MFKLKIGFITFSLFSLLLVGCVETPVEISTNEKHGFSISTFIDSSLPDSSMVLMIQFGDILYQFPKISINGKLVDTGYYPDYFYHRIAHFAENKIVYDIDFKGDRVFDTLLIPGRIDTIYCNGHILKDTLNVSVDSASSYTFTWKRASYCKLFEVSGWSNFSRDLRKTTSDTSAVILLNSTPPQYMSSYGSLYINGMSYDKVNRQSKPNKESGNLFVYYDGINGPERIVNFTIASK